MKKEKYIYLAHPLLSKDKVRKWQLKIEKHSNIKFLNPFYEGMYESKIIEEKLSKGVKLSYDEHMLIVENDKKLIKNSECVLVIVDGNLSYGAIQEMVYAKLYKKVVCLICTNKQENHSWLVYHSDHIFNSYKKFEEFIK
jgi:nucleoside 2-deoxyribosyltransferase